MTRWKTPSPSPSPPKFLKSVPSSTQLGGGACIIIDRVVKRVKNQLLGAEDKAREAGDKLITETREALMEYLEVEDTGYAF